MFLILAYQEILKIPTGAVHIQIQEAYESLNYLGRKVLSVPFIPCLSDAICVNIY